MYACLVLFWEICFSTPELENQVRLIFFYLKRWYRFLRFFVFLSLKKLELVPNLELRKQPGSVCWIIVQRVMAWSQSIFILFQKTKMFLTFEKKLATLLSVMHRGFVICVGIWHQTFSNAVTSRPGALPRLTQSVIILFRSALSVQGLLVYSIVRNWRVCEMFFISLLSYVSAIRKKI